MKKRRPSPAQPKRPTAVPNRELAVTLQRAITLHQQGHLAAADTLYRDILARQPNNFDALHLLGVIEYQRNNLLAAIELIDRAIAIYPNHAASHSNRGNALNDLKRYDEALGSYDRALSIKPDFAD